MYAKYAKHRPCYLIKDVIILQADSQHVCAMYWFDFDDTSQFDIGEVIRYVAIEMRKFINNPAKINTHSFATSRSLNFFVHTNSPFSPFRSTSLFSHKWSVPSLFLLVFSKRESTIVFISQTFTRLARNGMAHIRLGNKRNKLCITRVLDWNVSQTRTWTGEQVQCLDCARDVCIDVHKKNPCMEWATLPQSQW